jgi:hypothetical protein
MEFWSAKPSRRLGFEVPTMPVSHANLKEVGVGTQMSTTRVPNFDNFSSVTVSYTTDSPLIPSFPSADTNTILNDIWPKCPSPQHELQQHHKQTRLHLRLQHFLYGYVNRRAPRHSPSSSKQTPFTFIGLWFIAVNVTTPISRPTAERDSPRLCSSLASRQSRRGSQR